MELSMDQRKAILVIKNYLNVNGNLKYSDDYMMTEFELAIDELVENSIGIKSIKTTGIKSKSEGTQSVTFESNIEAWTITDNVKMLLPLPFIRLMG
ncbi:MAG: hypothetical protein WCR54_07900 [Clostridia bacterium]